MLVVVGPGDVVDLEEAPSLIGLSLVVDVPLVTVDGGRGVRLWQTPVRGLELSHGISATGNSTSRRSIESKTYELQAFFGPIENFHSGTSKFYSCNGCYFVERSAAD